MAKIRIGFSTELNIGSELSGIGTDNPTNTKQVLGNIHATNAKAVGVSTLATYQGFLDKEARFGKSVIDINAQAGTLGEVIIDGDVTVSSGSTLCSGVDELTLTDSFSVPTGNTDSRIHCHTAGSMRFNEDLGTLEFYTGDEWRTINSFKDTGNRGRGVFAGGSPSMSTISFLNIMSEGNTQNFGDLTYGLGNVAGKCSSGTRGLFSGGGNPAVNVIDFVTIMTTGDATDFGDLIDTETRRESCCSSTRGVIAGGDSPTSNKLIEFLTIATTGNTITFGELTVGRINAGSASSPTRGVFVGGGNPPTNINTIDFIEIATTGDALDFGDLDTAGSTNGVCRAVGTASNGHGGL